MYSVAKKKFKKLKVKYCLWPLTNGKKNIK